MVYRRASTAKLFCLVIGAPGSLAAFKAFWAVHSFEQRLQMTSEALKVALGGKDELLGQWKRIAKDLREVNDLRNDIAHGTVVGLLGEEVVLSPYFWERMHRNAETGIGLEEIEARSDRFHTVDVALEHFIQTVGKTIRPEGD